MTKQLFKNEFDIRLTKFTPESAKEVLRRFGNKNRVINKDKVAQYARDMKDGNWNVYNGDFIKFGTDNKIINGHHRLNAIVDHNLSINLYTMHGLPPEGFITEDTHRPRSSGDTLVIHGIKEGAYIAPIINQYIIYKSNKARGIDPNNKAKVTPTRKELTNEYSLRPMFWNDLVKDVKSWRKSTKSVLNKAMVGGLFAYLYDIDADGALDFFEQLSDNRPVTNNSIRLLRQLLISQQIKKQTKKEHLSPASIFNHIKDVWNLYRTGKELKSLRWKPSMGPVTPI